MKKNRAKIRHHRRVQVRFCQEGADEPRFGYVTNVSATGMFIETGKPFSKGDALDLEVSVADELVRLKVRVVRSLVMPTALRSVKASGMGLEFAGPGEQLVRLLQLLQLDDAPTGLPDVVGPRRLTRSAEISALKSFGSMQKIQVDPDRTSVDDPLEDRLRRAEQTNLRLSRELEKERRRRIGTHDGAKAKAAETGELRPELERLRKELEEARERARANRVNLAERLETSRQASGALKQRVQRLTTQVEELASERDRLRKKVERRRAAGVGEITITQPPLAVAPRQEGSFSKVLYLGIGLLLGAAGVALWLGAG